MTAGCRSPGAVDRATRPAEDLLLKRALKGHVRFAVLCVLGVACNASLFGPSLRATADGTNDFMSIYSGARLASTGGMYSLNENFRVQRETAGWENANRLFLRPPFDALLMWPLGQLPFRYATYVWECLIVASVALFCWVWPGDRKMAALVCCWSFPLFYVFADGQDVALILVLTALAMREMRRGRDTAAGIIFSLCSIKFHFLLLLPLLILRQKLWRFLCGLVAGGAILFAVSFPPGGWNWPAKYLELLRNPVSNPFPEAMPNIHGLTASLAYGTIWQAAGTLAVAVLAWFAFRRGGFEYGFAAVLVGGILVAPHAYLSDCAMAVPALLITMPLVTVAWQRNLHLFLMSPLCSIWAMIHPAWITTVALMVYLATTAFALGRPRRAD